MKEIPLTQGKIALVDDEDYEWLMQWKWYAKWSDGRWYAGRTKNNPKKNVKMHREIMNPSKGMVVDHINRNGLDNRRCNLRLCTQKENMRNQKIRIHSTTGYKGVHFFKRDGTYQAYISCDKKRFHLGYFKTAKEAARAYDAAAIKLHGIFASLNFPLS